VMRAASSSVRGVMAGSMAIPSSRSDEPADAGKLGEMVVGAAEPKVSMAVRA
jgi:hypothetical protein